MSAKEKTMKGLGAKKSSQPNLRVFVLVHDNIRTDSVLG